MRKKRKSKNGIGSHVNKYDGYSQVDKVRRSADKTNRLIDKDGNSNLSSIRGNLGSSDKVEERLDIVPNNELSEAVVQTETVIELVQETETKEDTSMHEVVKRVDKVESTNTTTKEEDTKEEDIKEEDIKEEDTKVVSKVVTEVEDSEIDETIEFWSKNEVQVKEMSVSQRISRGMVFWYDVHPERDKVGEHKINVRGNKFIDYVEYGRRPWVVVSNDTMNKRNTLVSICPMASGQAGTGSYEPSRVDLIFMGRKTSILCEQVRTITSAELTEYMSTLSDTIMDKVNDALLYHLNLVQKTDWDNLTGEGALSKIEQLIDSIVKHKVEEALKDAQKVTQSDIDGMMSRISSSFESIYSGMKNGTDSKIMTPALTVGYPTSDEKEEVKPKSQIDKFYEKYPEVKNNDLIREESKAESKTESKVDSDTKSKSVVKPESKVSQPKVDSTSKKQASVKSSIKSTPKKEDKKIPDRKVLVQAPKSEDDDTRRYMKWDLENMKKFIDDCNRHDIGYVTEKWGLETRVRCLKKKNYITHKLESMGMTV